MATSATTNIYYDDHSKAWVREVRDITGRWYVTGTYGSRQAAIAAGNTKPEAHERQAVA